LIPLASWRAGYFCFGKSSQNHCAAHAGFGNVVLPKLPSVLAERRPRRTRTSLCSNMRRLLRRSAARLGVVQRRVKSSISLTAVHGLLR